jgi:integrase
VIRTRLVPELGRLRLDGLNPAHLAAAYDRLLARGLSPKSVLNTHRLLHRALSDAVRWGMLVRNPCDLEDPPRAQRPAVRALDADEVSRLLAACAGDDLGPLVTVAVLTGLRLGELLGLTWDDIDLERGELRVVRAVQRVRGRGLVVVPKTASSRRLVPLPPQAVAALREQRRRQAEARLKASPAWADGNWVFTTALGLPYHPSDVAHRFQRLLEHAGLPRLRFHDLLHTTASLLLGEGVHPKVVASLLGHSTIQITLDTYSHVTPASLDRQRRRSARWLLTEMLAARPNAGGERIAARRALEILPVRTLARAHGSRTHRRGSSPRPPVLKTVHCRLHLRLRLPRTRNSAPQLRDPTIATAIGGKSILPLAPQ